MPLSRRQKIWLFTIIAMVIGGVIIWQGIETVRWMNEPWVAIDAGEID